MFNTILAVEIIRCVRNSFRTMMKPTRQLPIDMADRKPVYTQTDNTTTTLSPTQYEEIERLVQSIFEKIYNERSNTSNNLINTTTSTNYNNNKSSDDSESETEAASKMEILGPSELNLREVMNNEQQKAAAAAVMSSTLAVVAAVSLAAAASASCNSISQAAVNEET